MVNKTIHPSPPKKEGAVELKDLKKYSQMANNEKNDTAQELNGNTGDEVQRGKREGQWTTGGQEVTGTMQELGSEVKV